MTQFRYCPAGDCALVVEVGDAIAPEINQRVRGLLLVLQQHPVPGIREYLPTYHSLLIYYDPEKVLFDELVAHVQALEPHVLAALLPEPRIITLPVVYGGDFGLDLAFVAQHAGLPVKAVITLHAGRDYLVYMLGFTPGFCYLGGLAEQLTTPRLTTPRTQIPAGSVGIAGQQTGVYQIASPGGWQLIGRTPVKLFDPKRDPVVLIHAGDYIRFVPISVQDYQTISAQVTQDCYTLQIEFGSPRTGISIP